MLRLQCVPGHPHIIRIIADSLAKNDALNQTCTLPYNPSHLATLIRLESYQCPSTQAYFNAEVLSDPLFCDDSPLDWCNGYALLSNARFRIATMKVCGMGGATRYQASATNCFRSLFQ